MTPLLSLADVTKDYAARVLDQVDFDVRHGEIHALLGANGAGKSTLCKIVAGLIDASEGAMALDGTAYAPANKQAAERLGVQIVQQELNLIPTLSVGENVMFGRIPQRWGVIKRSQLRKRARAALDRVGLDDIELDVAVSRLGIGTQQMLEIAAALDRDCRVLILDEPTAALSEKETLRLFEWLDRVRGRGVGVIYISHRLDEVTRIADRVTILRDGKRVTTRQADELSTGEMVSLMSGEDVMSIARSHQSVRTDRVRLRVQGLAKTGVVEDIDFELHEGERLGVAGLVGSGRTELLRLIFGADVADRGSILLDEQKPGYRFTHPRQAVGHGLAMITEDRKRSGLMLPLSVRENLSLCDLGRLATLGVISGRAERSQANRLRGEMEISCQSILQPVNTLSGGNQQKVAVAKWLTRDGDVFLFDEPTRGIDVASRAAIYRLFDALAAEGKSILIVSSDVDELLETCDRILVMSAGRMVAQFDRENWSREAIIQASFAGYHESMPTTGEADE